MANIVYKIPPQFPPQQIIFPPYKEALTNELSNLERALKVQQIKKEINENMHRQQNIDKIQKLLDQNLENQNVQYTDSYFYKFQNPQIIQKVESNPKLASRYKQILERKQQLKEQYEYIRIQEKQLEDGLQLIYNEITKENDNAYSSENFYTGRQSQDNYYTQSQNSHKNSFENSPKNQMDVLQQKKNVFSSPVAKQNFYSAYQDSSKENVLHTNPISQNESQCQESNFKESSASKNTLLHKQLEEQLQRSKQKRIENDYPPQNPDIQLQFEDQNYKYEGDRNYQGYKEGYGELKNVNTGFVIYQGYWKDDYYSGLGTLFNEETADYEGEFNFQDLGNIQNYWQKYQGNFRNGVMDGRGMILMVNGEKIIGYFRDGKIQGAAEIFDSQGKGKQVVYQDDVMVNN